MQINTQILVAHITIISSNTQIITNKPKQISKNSYEWLKHKIIIIIIKIVDLE